MPRYFVVGIVHTALSHFSVEARDKAEAKQKAQEMFKNGDEEMSLGNEYDTIKRVFIDEE